MRWLPLIIIFIVCWIEISLFIEVASVMGVLMTMFLVILSSCVGVSLVKKQGIKNIALMQQKVQQGESPAAEMVKSVSLILAGLLLLLPGFFTDLLGLLLLLTPVQNHLTLKLLPHLYVWRKTSAPTQEGQTYEGEYTRKDKDEITRIDHKNLK